MTQLLAYLKVSGYGIKGVINRKMKTIFSKEDIEQYAKKAKQCMEKCIIEMGGDIDENARDELNVDLEEDAVYEDNCFEGFFGQINSCRFGNKLFVEIQKLGDYDGYYKDWSMKTYMQTMYEICDGMDDVWVSNYEYIDDDPAFRAFFIAFLFDIDEFKYYEEVYKYCHDFCDQLENLIKNFILVTKNLFGIKEYYGVQAKAGSLSGTATSNITEITNQINMGFNVPYKMVSGEDVYITKMIVAISGHYTDNAQAIIQTSVDKYKFANIIFLSKKELENHHVMVE